MKHIVMYLWGAITTALWFLAFYVAMPFIIFATISTGITFVSLLMYVGEHWEDD